jgi:hypothetical protein
MGSDIANATRLEGTVNDGDARSWDRQRAEANESDGSAMY